MCFGEGQALCSTSHLHTLMHLLVHIFKSYFLFSPHITAVGSINSCGTDVTCPIVYCYVATLRYVAFFLKSNSGKPNIGLT